jgi:hypothetical protein
MMSKLYICNDSFGSRINVGDTVELCMEWEMSSTWTSKVYWNVLDGAFVDAHPGHVKMGLAFHRNLREFIDREPMKIENEDGEIEVLRTYCKKVKNKKIRA